MRRRRKPWPASEGHGADADPTPGGWRPPPGVLPGWDWTPPGGLLLRHHGLPWWVRVWRCIPVADRCAQVWMWHHGGFTFPPSSRGSGGDPSGDRAPRGPFPQAPSLLRRLEVPGEPPIPSRR